MTCHNCRIDVTRHGKHRNGLQRYRCSQCGKTFTEPHQEAFRVEDHLKEERGILAVRLLVEGNSIRSVERVTGFHRNIIMQLLLVAGTRCEALLSTRVRNVPVNDVQADEIWGFVKKKEGHKNPFEGDDMYMGDAWCFVGIERFSKLVLCFELGKRTETSANRFMAKLADAASTENRFQLTTDGLPAYPSAVYAQLGERVDYAQLIKIYGQTPEGERRYSPPEVLGAEKKPIYGDPNPNLICTSHIERQNLTMRMQIRRLTRLTNAFSKKWDNLKAALALHFAYYNFCKVHGTIRQTPAMAAGIADRAWGLAELLAA